MVTFVNLLVRSDDFDHEAFLERWQGDHIELAKRLPGLERYATSVPTSPEYASYDGIVQLEFPDHETLSDAFDSEIGQEVQEDAATFIDMDESETLIVDETVHLNEADTESDDDR